MDCRCRRHWDYIDFVEADQHLGVCLGGTVVATRGGGSWIMEPDHGLSDDELVQLNVSPIVLGFRSLLAHPA